MERRSGRFSPQDALTSLLGRLSSFRSVNQLHDQLRAQGLGIGLATVYRLLEAMYRTGEVDRIIGSRGEARYRLCSSADKYHQPLVCTTCDVVVEVDSADLGQWAHSTAADHGFIDVQLRATIAGTCSRCRNSVPNS